MHYIVEAGNGNPKILERLENGAYKTIGFGAGENSLSAMLMLVALANKTIDGEIS